MNQIREQLHKLAAKMKEAFAAYRVTVTVIMLTSFFSAITYMLEYEFDVSIPYDEDTVWRALVFFAFAAFFSEVCFIGRRLWKIAGFVLGGVIAVCAAWCFGLRDTVQFAGLNGGVVNEYAHRLIAGYLLLLTITALYVCVRRSGLRFEEYLIRAFCGFCVVSIVFFALEIGMTLIGAAFDVLFLEGDANLNYALAVIIFGVYYVPACITVVTNTKQGTEGYLRAMIKGLLSGMTICALAVVYLYVAKILIVHEMPSNEIFSIISWLFCLGMPVWIMTAFYDDDGKYSCILRILPYIFFPLILLQAYSMGVRIYDYGMTPDRYMGVMLMLFEIGVILIWRFSRRKLERIMPFLCACIVVAVFLPGINMYSVSNRWQLSVLQKYYQTVQEGGMLSEIEYDRLKGAYDYLYDQPEMKETVAADYDIYGEDFAESLSEILEKQEMNTTDLTKLETYYIHCCQMVGKLDVSGYTGMNMMITDESYETHYQEYADVDYTRFRFVIRETGEVITLDIDEFAQKCLAYDKKYPDSDTDELSRAMKPYQAIQIDDISGMLLQK